MSTRYNTGNPIESTDVRDMSDNAKNLDLFSNSSELSFDDRFGVERKTIHGMNSEFDGMIVGMNSEFDAQILNMGFTRVGTFLSGATLTNPRQTLLWDIADGGDGQEYGWSGAFPKVVPASSTPASTGGISVGAWISRFDPELRIQVREALRRSYAEAGYNLVAGSFEAGGTVTAATDVLLHEAEGVAYSWGGTLPKVVAAGSTPVSAGGIGAGAWVYRTDVMLRSELNANDGQKLIGICPDIATLRTIEPDYDGQRITLKQHTSGASLGGGQFRSLVDGSSYTDNNGTIIKTSGGAVWLRIDADILNPLMFGAIGDGVTDDTQAIQQAMDSDGIVFDGGGRIFKHTSSILISKKKRITNARFIYDGQYTSFIHKVTSDDVTVDNCEFDGNDKCVKVFQVTNSSRIKITNSEFKNAYSDGSLGLSGPSAWASGVYVIGGSNEVSISDCTVRNIHADWDGTEIEKDETVCRGVAFVVAGDTPKNCSVTRNSFYGIIGGSGAAIHFLASRVGTYFDSMDFSCEFNSIYGVTNRAIKIQASVGSVVGNKHFLGQEYLQSFLDTHSLAGLHEFWNAKANISVILAQHVNVSNNQFVAPGYISSMLLDGCDFVSASNNKVVQNALRAGSQAGSSMLACSNSQMESNVIIGPKRGTYMLGSSDSNIINNNDYIDVTEAGVYVEAGCDRNHFTENRISGTTTPLACVRVTDSNANNIARNDSNIEGVPAVRIGGTSEQNVITGNFVYKTNGSIVIFDNDTKNKNGARDNYRTKRLFEVDIWPITYGKYSTGDVIKVNNGDPTEPLLYVCRFGGEYGSGTDPVFVLAVKIP